MSSINDVLKEKFNVSGSNIAETLSKITPGGGLSGSTTNGWLVVESSETISGRLNKTLEQIIEAAPFVLLYNADSDSGSIYLLGGYEYDDEDLRWHIYFHNFDGDGYIASSLNDYPIAYRPDESGEDIHFH